MLGHPSPNSSRRCATSEGVQRPTLRVSTRENAFGAGNQNGQPTDQTGKARPPVAPAIGATETLLKAPSASATLVAVTSGAGTYVAKVVYRDNTGINAGTIAAGNVTLTGPGGALSPVGSPSISGSGTSVTVT